MTRIEDISIAYRTPVPFLWYGVQSISKCVSTCLLSVSKEFMTQQEVQGNCLMFDFASLVLPMCQRNSVFDPPHKPLSEVSSIILSVKRRNRDSKTLPEVSELVCVGAPAPPQTWRSALHKGTRRREMRVSWNVAPPPSATWRPLKWACQAVSSER